MVSYERRETNGFSQPTARNYAKILQVEYSSECIKKQIAHKKVRATTENHRAGPIPPGKSQNFTLLRRIPPLLDG